MLALRRQRQWPPGGGELILPRQIPWKVIEEDIRSQLWASTCTHRCAHTHHNVYTHVHTTHTWEKKTRLKSQQNIILVVLWLPLRWGSPCWDSGQHLWPWSPRRRAWYLKPLKFQWAVSVHALKSLGDCFRQLVKERVELTALLCAP